MSKRTDLLEHASVSKALIALSIPSILAMFMNAIYNIADAYFIGKLGDTAALAAVSLIFPVTLVIGAIGLGFGIGGGSAASRLLGEKDLPRAIKITSSTFFLSMVSATLFLVLGLIFAEPFLRAMNAEGAVLEYGLSYLRIILVGGFFQILNMTMNNIIRAEGAASYSSMAISIGAILNIVLDPIFIFALKMGVTGAAVATTIGQFIAFIVAISFFFSKRSTLKIKFSAFSKELRDYVEILKIGTPSFLRQVLSGFSSFLMLGLITSYGDESLAAIGAVVRLIMFASFAIFGFSHAFQPVAGYNYGALKFGKMYESLKFSLVITSVYSLIMAIIMFVVPEQLIMIFSKDPDVLKMGVKALQIFAISFPIIGFQVIYSTFFQAIGSGTASFISAIARQGLILIPLLYVLNHYFALDGVILSQPAADYLSLILTIILGVYIQKRLRREEQIYNEKVSTNNALAENQEFT